MIRIGGACLVLSAMAGCRSPAGAGVDAAHVEPVAVPGASSAPVPSNAPSVVPAAVPSAPTDWCVEGLSALDEDVCYLLPSSDAGAPRRLLVYLHGIVPPVAGSPQQHTVQRAVQQACTRAGVAALVPRGRRGIGPSQARDWWAWPTTPAAVAEMAPSLVARWAEAKRRLEAVAGAPFARTYLAGSSNGAYFLSMLAARGELPSPAFPVDGFGAMSGGAASGSFPGTSPRPFYVGWGAFDVETKPRAGGLAAALRVAHWPVLAREHSLSHGANEVYLDEAFAFWESQEQATESPRRP